MGRLATEAVENGADEVVNQALTTGRVDPKAGMLGMIPGLGAASRKAGGALKVQGGLANASGLNVASGAAGSICTKRKYGFAPDTKVLMADGSKRPMRDINVGDKVLATDPTTGNTVAEPVTLLHRNTDYDMTRLTVKDQDGLESVLNTIQNYPFWNGTNQ